MSLHIFGTNNDVKINFESTCNSSSPLDLPANSYTDVSNVQNIYHKQKKNHRIKTQNTTNEFIGKYLLKNQERYQKSNTKIKHKNIHTHTISKTFKVIMHLQACIRLKHKYARSIVKMMKQTAVWCQVHLPGLVVSPPPTPPHSSRLMLGGSEGFGFLGWSKSLRWDQPAVLKKQVLAIACITFCINNIKSKNNRLFRQTKPMQKNKLASSECTCRTTCACCLCF